MTNRRWLILTLLTIAGLVSANFLVTYQLDVYGLLRDPHGRRLATSVLYSPMTDDRIFKYIANHRYVPANFDGVIIGSSSSANWYPNLIHSYNLYDESVIGGKASEEKILIDQLPPDAHFRVALCAISPYIVNGHDLSHGLGQVTRMEPLGSIDSLAEELAKVLTELHLRPQTYFADGSHRFPEKQHLDPQVMDTSYFQIDPASLAAYRSLILDLQARGARIIYVEPPMYLPVYGNFTQFQQTIDSILAALPPGPTINFIAPEYSAFNSDPKNFTDGLHLSPEGATRISTMLDQKLALLGPSS